MRRTKLFVVALLLAVSAAVGVLGANARAAGNTCTWAGTAGDNKFSTAANWTGCAGTAPIGDDSLLFSLSATDLTLDNDITGLSVANVTVTNDNSLPHFVQINGNELVVTGTLSDAPTTCLGGGCIATVEFMAPLKLGADVTVNSGVDAVAVNLNGHVLSLGDGAIITGVISGTGSIQVVGGEIYLTGANTWTGPLVVNPGQQLYAGVASLGNATNTVTVASGGGLAFCGPNGASVPQNFTVAGQGGIDGALASWVSCSQKGPILPPSEADVALTGVVTLTADTQFGAQGIFTVNNLIANGHTLGKTTTSTGSLVVNTTSTPTPPPSGTPGTTIYGDNQPTAPLVILAGQTAVVDGTRGDVTINGGTLMGTGLVGALTMTAGVLAPGHSPGILRSSGVAFTGGEYQVEIGGRREGKYDQLKVKGAVNLGTATKLLLSHWKHYRPRPGDTFVIVQNDGKDSVRGTFKGLPEGARLTVDGVSYSISYKGGTHHNDVVLRVQPPARHQKQHHHWYDFWHR